MSTNETIPEACKTNVPSAPKIRVDPGAQKDPFKFMHRLIVNQSDHPVKLCDTNKHSHYKIFDNTRGTEKTSPSCRAIEKGDISDLFGIQEEQIEKVGVSRNELWLKCLEYQIEVSQLKEQLKELQIKHEKDMHAVACQASELNQLTSENHQLKNKLQKMREESEKSLQDTYGGHETKVSQLNSIIQQLHEELQLQKEQQVNKLGGKISELKKLLREEGEKNEKAIHEHVRKHDVEVSQLNEKIAGLQEQFKLEEKERKEEHKKEIDAMKQSFLEERRKLEEQLDLFLRQARKRPVQLSYLGKGDLMPKVLEELKTALVDKLGIKRHELQFVTCLKGNDVDLDIPLIALCIHVSRLGTDAYTTMQNIQASKNVLLVILHHKDEHALPSQTSDRVLTGPEFHDLAGIYDIGFLADKGIYACKMNNTTIDCIVEFITKKEATMNSKPDKLALLN